MSAAIERLRGRIEALELISIAAIAKLAAQDDGMRRDVLETMHGLSESGVKGLSPVALVGFREVFGRVIWNLDPQGSEQQSQSLVRRKNRRILKGRHTKSPVDREREC